MKTYVIVLWENVPNTSHGNIILHVSQYYSDIYNYV